MTRAPAAASARAVARPMPRDAPVTSAVLPRRSVMVVLLSGSVEVDGGRVRDLRGGLAAIDVDDLAGDERRSCRGDEHDGVGDLLRLPCALQRNARDHAGLAVGPARARGPRTPRLRAPPTWSGLRLRACWRCRARRPARRAGPWSTTD